MRNECNLITGAPVNATLGTQRLRNSMKLHSKREFLYNCVPGSPSCALFEEAKPQSVRQREMRDHELGERLSHREKAIERREEGSLLNYRLMCCDNRSDGDFERLSKQNQLTLVYEIKTVMQLKDTMSAASPSPIKKKETCDSIGIFILFIGNQSPAVFGRRVLCSCNLQSF